MNRRMLLGHIRIDSTHAGLKMVDFTHLLGLHSHASATTVLCGSISQRARSKGLAIVPKVLCDVCPGGILFISYPLLWYSKPAEDRGTTLIKSKTKHNKANFDRAGDAAPWLGAWTASSVSSTHVGRLATARKSSLRGSPRLWHLWAPVLLGTHTCIH